MARLAVIAVAVGAPISFAHAQTAKPAPAPAAAPAPAPAAGSGQPSTDVPADVLPDVPAGEAGSETRGAEETNLAPTTVPMPATPAAVAPPPIIFPTVGPGVIKKKRVKPLTTSVGLDPTAPDFGAEADLVSIANEGTPNIKPKRWTFVMHGFLRAPLRIGIGPTSTALNLNGQMSDAQLHSPPHVVGATNDQWTSVGLSPAPIGAMYLSVGNAVVSGTLIISAGTFFDAGYRNIDEMGGVNQGYVTMKFNDAFGSRGGLALTAGAFVNRYGMAGPRQQSSGYYNTPLFGATRVVGESLTADFDLTDKLELIIEDGIGAKLEVVPWLGLSTLSKVPYLPDQGPTPQGSNFVHHAHAALLFDDWLRVGAHFMTSYSPNDLSTSTGLINGDTPSSTMHVFGGEVHTDSARYGSGYVGYSRIDATRVLSLADGIQALHATNGLGLIRNYLNPGYFYNGDAPLPAPVPGSVGDTGTIDTVLFQYILRMAPLLELPATGRDLSLGVFGMYNHVKAPAFTSGSQDKFKVGGELSFAATRFLSVGARFDRVMPDGGNADVAYSAISPRMILHTSWLSREYILLSYTRYIFGNTPPFVPAPYEGATEPDKNLIVLSGLVSF